jgi:hypothetical protein
MQSQQSCVTSAQSGLEVSLTHPFDLHPGLFQDACWPMIFVVTGRGDAMWVEYYCNGKSYRESSASTQKMMARKLLDRHEREISKGKFPGVHFEKLTFDQLAEPR